MRQGWFFLPRTAARITAQRGHGLGADWRQALAWGCRPPRRSPAAAEPLFPKRVANLPPGAAGG